MNRQNTAIVAIILTFVTSVTQANSADNLTGDQIKAYDAGKYKSAEELGEKVVAAYPTDYNARYYLANTYVKLNKNEKAISEYRICLGATAASAKLKEYSSTALERLLKQKEQALVVASQGDDQPKDKELRDFKKRISKETRHEERRLRQEWNRALERLEDNYGGRGNMIFRGFGGGFDWRRANQETQRFDNERYRLNDFYSKKMAALAEHEESMLTQANCGTGKIRLAPGLSGSNVKNYINYGDESEAADIPVDNPLHAKAKSLSDVAPVLAKPTAGRKVVRPTGSINGKTSGRTEHVVPTKNASGISLPTKTVAHSATKVAP